ncbi:polysaccharide biosynthesis protein [Paucibacter sp. Y2R2-4]|uniref:polysaccharide biosynthesis protein n=1 Tax=Paucibacter sp. Y2R2-4 TaxID=2893553 RepID=UPI0021E48B9D|nr:nucleoside-diphosphate sugar epimerase/dehydratase [Paucibacter sp. Y2R2-4]MCV2349742.1 polysaccharide biosynthesis protein [Paucibacter sp. Y2R2-4]
MNWLSLDAFLTRIRPQREALALGLDLAVVALAWQATYLFRLGFERWFSARPAYDHWVLLGFVLLYALVLKGLKVPKGMWRFSGFGEVQRLALVCLIAGLIGATVVLMAQLSKVPRAVLALHPLFTLMGLAMLRMGYRMLYEHMRSRISGSAQEQRRALVLGAGDAGRLLVAGIQHSQGWVVVGYLDDAPNKRGARVGGVPVLGALDEAKHFAELHGITHLIVAMPAVTVAQRRRALDLAGQVGLPVLTVPSSQELLAGRHVDQVRDIEPEDLLGREPVELDEGGISECLAGKVVLITGAGGSIGSELCRQVARYGPSKIVLYELSEFALYTIEQELGEKFPHIPLVRLVGDVKDLEHLRYVFDKYRPQIVFHAAAYKHVPLMEEDNAWACLRNNTLGTYNACQAAAEHGVERFVLISTDKAVNPTNVMGATKRAAELVISHMAAESEKQGHATKFMAVRFGNVLGSSGSVIPKFKEQIAKGGPVTVTHPDITRYFMTIPEAARLVVQAAVIGESGQVLILDMGEPVKILDLARDMIRLAGRESANIRIEFSGLRPGEKLFEELLADSDSTVPTGIGRLRIACLAQQSAETEQLMALLERAKHSLAPQSVHLHDELTRLGLGYLKPAWTGVMPD